MPEWQPTLLSEQGGVETGEQGGVDVVTEEVDELDPPVRSEHSEDIDAPGPTAGDDDAVDRRAGSRGELRRQFDLLAVE
jgi:hypothetical protein